MFFKKKPEKRHEEMHFKQIIHSCFYQLWIKCLLWAKPLRKYQVVIFMTQRLMEE